jgi:hypothetical protein
MKAAIIVAITLGLGLLPASAEVVVCQGRLTTIDAVPPNVIAFEGRSFAHVGYISDLSGDYRCMIDRDGGGHYSQMWRCNAHAPCRVVGIVAGKSFDLIWRRRNGKPFRPPTYVIVDVLSAERPD